MGGFALHVREKPIDGEIYVKGDGAVLSAVEDGKDIEILLNALARFQHVARKENIGAVIRLDGKGNVVETIPSNLNLKP